MGVASKLSVLASVVLVAGCAGSTAELATVPSDQALSALEQAGLGCDLSPAGPGLMVCTAADVIVSVLEDDNGQIEAGRIERTCGIYFAAFQIGFVDGRELEVVAKKASGVAAIEDLAARLVVGEVTTCSADPPGGEDRAALLDAIGPGTPACQDFEPISGTVSLCSDDTIAVIIDDQDDQVRAAYNLVSACERVVAYYFVVFDEGGMAEVYAEEETTRDFVLSLEETVGAGEAHSCD